MPSCLAKARRPLVSKHGQTLERWGRGDPGLSLAIHVEQPGPYHRPSPMQHMHKPFLALKETLQAISVNCIHFKFVWPKRAQKKLCYTLAQTCAQRTHSTHSVRTVRILQGEMGDFCYNWQYSVQTILQTEHMANMTVMIMGTSMDIKNANESIITDKGCS